MTDVPHFSFPFRFVNPSAATTEQDSLDEIADCVYAILVCPAGFRIELPLFGLTDQTFAMPQPDLDDIRGAIDTWEPRALLTLTQQQDQLDALIADVTAAVAARSQE
jgi:hypothetical protein